MKPVILTLLVVVLPFQLTTTKGFIDCRTACRKCREGFDDVNILEVYCSMCKECRDRRRERVGQPQLPSGPGRPGFAGLRPGPGNLRPGGRGNINRQSSLRTRTFYRTPYVGRMDDESKGPMESRDKRNVEADYAKDLMLSELQKLREELRQWKITQTIARGIYVPIRQQKQSQTLAQGMYVPTRRQRVWTRRQAVNVARTAQVDDDEEYMATWPEHCPTPPVCSSGEDIEMLTKARTPTTTTTTTTTTEPTTTTTTTTTTEAATCPPIKTCRKKKKSTPACIPCMPMCPAPCPAQPLIPSEINVNINWNGKIPPFEFTLTPTENEPLKFTKTKPTSPSDWIENPGTVETIIEAPMTTHLQTTTFPSTTTAVTDPITVPTIPMTEAPITTTAPITTSAPITTPVPSITTVCPPQPNSSSNPCCYFPLAFQGQLSLLGFNCDPQKQGLISNGNPITTLNPVTISDTNDHSKKFVIDEELIRKILINSNQNNNGNENNGHVNNKEGSNTGVIGGETTNNGNNNGNSGHNENHNNNGGLNNGVIGGETNNNGYNNGKSSNNDKNNIYGGHDINPRDNINRGTNSEYPNNGIHDQNQKGGPSNREYTELQRKIVMNENPYNDRSLHRKIVMNERNNDRNSINNNGGANFEYPNDGNYNQNGKGGPSNLEYDIQNKKPIDENPYNDRNLQRKIIINNPNNDLKRNVAINKYNSELDRKIVINEDENKDKQNVMNEGVENTPCDKKTKNNRDQDYYYVYVGLPKNLVGSRRATTPMDLPVMDFPQSGMF